MTYSEVIDFLFSQLPMYQKSGAVAYKNNLDNTLILDEYFGHPHNKFKSVHVAGTNGKGSVSHMLASILQQAGYKTGLYTSPHLVDFRERIRINGDMISQKEVVDFIVDNQKLIVDVGPSFFELTVAMAFNYFARNRVEVAVVETGLGGRLDSTNIINPVLSVITNIGLDHTALLGSDLSLIAFEKAGIIKKKTPVVIGRRDDQTFGVFDKKAKYMMAPLFMADHDVEVNFIRYGDSFQVVEVLKNGNVYLSDLELPLKGNYQLENLRTVIVSIEQLISNGFIINEHHIRKGLERVLVNTGFKGRWQILSRKPLTICDTGHNVDGIGKIVEQLATMDYENLHFVLGMVSDKDVDNILCMLPKEGHYYFTRANIPRSIDPELLKRKSLVYGLKGEIYKSVSEAYEKAKKNAEGNDLIFIGGSTFVVAEVV